MILNKVTSSWIYQAYVKNEELNVQNVCHHNNLGMNELFDGLCFGHTLLKVC
jgi:hypothetical protein